MQPPGSWNRAAELVSVWHPPGRRTRLSGLCLEPSRSPKLSGGPTGTKGRRTSHGGAGGPALPSAATGNALARQAAPGRSSLRLAFVRDPAPAPHVGPEPGRVGVGSLGRPTGRIPGGPELSLRGESR